MFFSLSVDSRFSRLSLWRCWGNIVTINVVPDRVSPTDPFFVLQCLEKAKEMELRSSNCFQECVWRGRSHWPHESLVFSEYLSCLLFSVSVRERVGCLGNVSWALCLKLGPAPHRSGPWELHLALNSLENGLEEKSPLRQCPPGHPWKLLSLPGWNTCTLNKAALSSV